MPREEVRFVMARRLVLVLLLVVVTQFSIGCHHRHFCRFPRWCHGGCFDHCAPTCDPCCDPCGGACFKPGIPISPDAPAVQLVPPTPGMIQPPLAQPGLMPLAFGNH